MKNCVLIGSGNVAWSLAPALQDAGYNVSQVWSRNPYHAAELAAEVGADAIIDLAEIRHDADIYIITVTDDGIASLASRLTARDGLCVHTSGSVNADALSPITDTYGVLYPLQTFTKGRVTELSDVPVYIEAADPATLERIREVASAISSRVRCADSRQRRRIHAAAVFACNFTNHLWAIADRLLRQTGDGLSVLYPLITETTRKAMEMPPLDAQTGPARRGDKRIVSAHIHALDADDARVYAAISESIMKTYTADERD